ncbi:MAG: hypothetical protein KKD39_03345, partial [Candidatus Altiarchaeota archaeon]|nr:hypothetical protein [Candidatus Altiarchaeota archaeon]
LAFEVFEKNMKVAVTDHYSLAGVRESIEELYKIKKIFGENDSEIVSGIEFSARIEKKDFMGVKKIHVLGVGVDTQSRHLRRWVDSFDDTRLKDINYALEIKEELESKGFMFDPNTDERLQVYRNVYKALARSMYSEKNTVVMRRVFGVSMNERRDRYKSKKKRRLRIEKSIVESMRERYGDFNANKPCLREAVEIIKKSGGVVILPHIVSSNPKTAYLGLEELTCLFRTFGQYGVDAIEAYHPAHRIDVADKIAKAVEKAGLYVTGGSDAHHREQKIGCFGNMCIQ